MTNNLSVIGAREPTFQKLARLLDRCSDVHGCEGCIQSPSCIRAWDEFVANSLPKGSDFCEEGHLVTLP